MHLVIFCACRFLWLVWLSQGFLSRLTMPHAQKQMRLVHLVLSISFVQCFVYLLCVCQVVKAINHSFGCTQQNFNDAEFVAFSTKVHPHMRILSCDWSHDYGRVSRLSRHSVLAIICSIINGFKYALPLLYILNGHFLVKGQQWNKKMCPG